CSLCSRKLCGPARNSGARPVPRSLSVHRALPKFPKHNRVDALNFYTFIPINFLLMYLIYQARLFISSAVFIAFLSILSSCNRSTPTSPDAKLAFERVIPKPVSVTSTGQTFFIKDGTAIVVESEESGLDDVANYLAETLDTLTGLSFNVTSVAKDGAIILALGGSSDLGAEGYQLQINEKQIRIAANTPAGVFH